MIRAKHSQSGFTLVEVAIAIALLGMGLITLTGLATRLMNDTREEVNRIRASFFAQYIIELKLADRFNNNNNQNKQAPPSSSGSLYQKLSEVQYFDGIENNSELDYLKSWSYSFDIQQITLPFTTSNFEKYHLKITWGNDANQQFELETIKKSKDTAQANDSTSGGDDSGV